MLAAAVTTSRAPRTRCSIAWLVAVAGLTGCVAHYPLQVTVQATSGEPLEGVVVSCVCDEGTSSAGAVSDGRGVAALTLFHDEPEQCLLTAAARGYRTQQRALEDLSPVELVMEAYPP